MSWLNKIKAGIGKKSPKDEDLWVNCKKCKEQIYIAELEDNLKVCPRCEYHFRLDARQRIHLLIDQETFIEQDQDLTSPDPLKFKDTKKYKDRIADSQKKTGLKDAVRTAHGMSKGKPLVIACMDFSFIGGSMGSVVGEKISRAIDYSYQNNIPILIISKSGGARMMEAGISLMQLAKGQYFKRPSRRGIAKVRSLVKKSIEHLRSCS